MRKRKRERKRKKERKVEKTTGRWKTVCVSAAWANGVFSSSSSSADELWMFEWSAGRLNGAKLHLKQAAAAVIHLRVLTPTATTTTTTTTTIRHMTATDAHYPQFDAFFPVFHFRKLTLSLPFFSIQFAIILFHITISSLSILIKNCHFFELIHHQLTYCLPN